MTSSVNWKNSENIMKMANVFPRVVDTTLDSKDAEQQIEALRFG